MASPPGFFAESCYRPWDATSRIPGAQTLNYRGMVQPTANGRFVLVQNATPATSITVVDLSERKVAGQIATPGCWGTLPAASHPARLAMLCGDGKIATVTLDDKGQVVDRHTGDLATIDEQGYCNIVGRVKDMVIRGGENVYPREVEEFLFRHPKVAAVQVFGVPDMRYGEELCAWIITRPGAACTEDEVRAFCHDQIAHYKVPRYIRFVDELPVTVTGKPQKFLMREAMMRELGMS